MKKEYDFSKSERGKFYRKGAQLRLPIYLDARTQILLEKIAGKKHQAIDSVVEGMIRKEAGLGR